MKDTILYEKIGLSPYLSDEDLKRDGRKLLLKYHPDKNENKEESSKKFIEIKEILDILCDPKQRFLYHEIGISILSNRNVENREENKQDLNKIFNDFNNLFGNFTKLMNNMNDFIHSQNINNVYDNDINYIVKVNLEIIDPYIPVILNVVYKRYRYDEKYIFLYKEEERKVIVTISVEKLIDMIEKKQTIIMPEQGNILKDKRTNLVISIEEME